MTKPKHIKIGFSFGNKPLKDHYFKPKTTITIGNSKRNKIVIPSWPGRDKFPLLVYTRKGYQLNYTDSMIGRLSIGNHVLTLDDLIARGLAMKTKNSYQVYISEKVRGKFILEGIKILLIFVLPTSVRN